MFRITGNKGFQLTFANGYTASVQFGQMDYCTNRNARYCGAPERGECADAEIAVWGPSGKFISCGGDDARGWVSSDEVAAFLGWVAAIDPGNPPERVPDFGKTKEIKP